jgi:hypothetical protein
MMLEECSGGVSRPLACSINQNAAAEMNTQVSLLLWLSSSRDNLARRKEILKFMKVCLNAIIVTFSSACHPSKLLVERF